MPFSRVILVNRSGIKFTSHLQQRERFLRPLRPSQRNVWVGGDSLYVASDTRLAVVPERDEEVDEEHGCHTSNGQDHDSGHSGLPVEFQSRFMDCYSTLM